MERKHNFTMQTTCLRIFSREGKPPRDQDWQNSFRALDREELNPTNDKLFKHVQTQFTSNSFVHCFKRVLKTSSWTSVDMNHLKSSAAGTFRKLMSCLAPYSEHSPSCPNHSKPSRLNDQGHPLGPLSCPFVLSFGIGKIGHERLAQRRRTRIGSTSIGSPQFRSEMDELDGRCSSARATLDSTSLFAMRDVYAPQTHHSKLKISLVELS